MSHSKQTLDARINALHPEQQRLITSIIAEMEKENARDALVREIVAKAMSLTREGAQ